MLHRLVGRPVFAHADAVVGEDVDDRRFHQRRQANGRPHVVGEDQERAAIGTHAAVQGHAVEDAAHGVFAHAEANVAAGEVAPPQVAGPLQVGLVRWRQVARTAQQRRHLGRDGVENDARRHAGGHALARLEQLIHVQGHVELAIEHVAEQLAVVGEGPLIVAPQLLPLAHARRAVAGRLAQEVAGLSGHVEGLVGGQAQGLLGQSHLVRPQGFAVGLGRAGAVGAAEADSRAAGDERRPLRLGRGLDQRRAHRQRVVPVDARRVPAVGLEPLQHVL